MSARAHTRLLSLVLLALLPLACQGAAVDFDLRGWGWLVGSPITLEQGGLSLTVSASDDRLFQSGNLGVGNYGPAGGNLVGEGESLTFDLGAATARLATTTFSGLQGALGGVRVYGDGVALGEYAFTFGATGAQLDFEPNGWLASSFTFEGVTGTNAGFGISGFGVATTVADVGAVPLPTSVWLLASALGFMGIFHRRWWRGQTRHSEGT